MAGTNKGTFLGISGSDYQMLGTGISGISSLISGLSQAGLIEEQGALSRSDYYRKAALTRDEGSRLRAKQAMGYISSGIELVGTPQLVMKETMMKARAEAKAQEITGDNIYALAQKNAANKRMEGVSSLIGSVLQIGSIAAGA